MKYVRDRDVFVRSRVLSALENALPPRHGVGLRAELTACRCSAAVRLDKGERHDHRATPDRDAFVQMISAPVAVGTAEHDHGVALRMPHAHAFERRQHQDRQANALITGAARADPRHVQHAVGA